MGAAHLLWPALSLCAQRITYSFFCGAQPRASGAAARSGRAKNFTKKKLLDGLIT
jgi:hypothetical protein